MLYLTENILYTWPRTSIC